MPDTPPAPYCLDDQIGFILRRSSQRHLAIFGTHISALTPMQFAALAKLSDSGPLSQNALGRLTAMDGATIKGVVDRLRSRGHVQTTADQKDRRRTVVALTNTGKQIFSELVARAEHISATTLEPLTKAEQKTLVRLLQKMT